MTEDRDVAGANARARLTDRLARFAENPSGHWVWKPSDIEAVRTLLSSVSDRERGLVEALSGIRWHSADRDNMEFTARITCWQMDAIRAALTLHKEKTNV